MVQTVAPLALALLAGFSLVVQQGLNANMRVALGSAAWAGVASYVVGLACMMVLALSLRDPTPSAALAGRIPWWAWTGGAFGATFIGLGIFLVPQIGAATFFALLVTGQMLASMTFDHFGWLGIAQRPVDMSRLAGVVLLIAGVVLIRR
jgi:bacterial/archaeal transporter family-2 protein